MDRRFFLINKELCPGTLQCLGQTGLITHQFSIDVKPGNFEGSNLT